MFKLSINGNFLKTLKNKLQHSRVMQFTLYSLNRQLRVFLGLVSQSHKRSMECFNTSLTYTRKRISNKLSVTDHIGIYSFRYQTNCSNMDSISFVPFTSSQTKTSYALEHKCKA